MNVLLKAFLISFFFFSGLFAVVTFSEDFMNRQGVSYPMLLRPFSKSSATPQITPLPPAQIGNGDANTNSMVDFGDIHYISSNWNTTAGGAIDQYKDGKVNSLDFVVVVEQLSR